MAFSSTMANQLYQIKISLLDFSPTIWRTVLVPSNMSLGDFHMVIQIAMGWENGHLHQFMSGRTFYVEDEDPDFGTFGKITTINYSQEKTTLMDVLPKVKSKLKYEYDFGDGWLHELLLEKVLPFNENTTVPVCLDGKMACPPEDCGGVWGYGNMLEILKNPAHEEYEETLEWIGEEFDPEVFDKAEPNATFEYFRKSE